MDKKTQEKLDGLRSNYESMAKRRADTTYLPGNKWEILASDAYNAYAAFNNSLPGQTYIMTARNRGR